MYAYTSTLLYDTAANMHVIYDMAACHRICKCDVNMLQQDDYHMSYLLLYALCTHVMHITSVHCCTCI
jgi:hypothetical protein